MKYLVVFKEGESPEVLVRLKYYKDSIAGRAAALALAASNDAFVLEVEAAQVT